jgi:soluble lytic murein transglycosylase-like protein
MTSTRKASPLHALLFATLVMCTGGAQAAGAENRLAPSPVSKVQTAAKAVPGTLAKFFKVNAKKRAEYSDEIQAAAQASKVDPALIEAVISAESAFDPKAVSRTGAVGMMQLMPKTAIRWGVKDRTNAAQNILGGAKYLKFLLHKFNDRKLAIAAYNAGEGNVKKHGNKIPPFPETQKYVPKVLAYYDEYRVA